MADGDIGAPVNTKEIVVTDIYWPEIIHVAGDIYAVAYTDSNSDPVVATWDISTAGVIGSSMVDDQILIDTGGAHPSIKHVAGEVYAVAYRGAGTDGCLRAITITSAGAISLIGAAPFIFEADSCYEPDMIKVPAGSDVFAIVCRGAANQGIINTVTITDAGAISAIEMKEAWATNINSPRIVHVSGSVFAIVSRDNAYDGYVHTIGISAAGLIDDNVTAFLEFDADRGFSPSICHVSGSVFAIAYQGPGFDGYIVTITISTAGAIALCGGANGLLEFDAAACFTPDIIHLCCGVCAIAYSGVDSDGYVCTIQIDAAGQISALDSKEIYTQDCNYPSIIRISGDQYAVAYVGAGSDGFINTPTIVTPVEGRIKYLMMMGVG